MEERGSASATACDGSVPQNASARHRSPSLSLRLPPTVLLLQVRALPPGCPQAQGNQWALISTPLLNGSVGGERSYFQSDMNFLITFSITS